MSDEHDKPKEDATEPADADTDSDRPTVAPPFDPIEFAKDVWNRPSPERGIPAQSPPGFPKPAGVPMAPTPTPMGLGVARAPMPTVSDPIELEEARQQSIKSIPSTKHTPAGGALAFANAQMPSVMPGPPLRAESSASLGSVGREWGDMELSTQPPPATTESTMATRPPGRGDGHAQQSAPPRDDGPPVAAGPPTEQEMNDRVSLGDYTGALEVAERILAIDRHHAAALACAESSRSVLKQMYTARVGPLERVPTVAVARDQLRWLSIDHRAGFVLSLIDGVSSVEMILDVSGMPELDALRILSELAQQRIISFR